MSERRNIGQLVRRLRQQPAPVDEPDSWEAKANATYAAMLREFRAPRSTLLREYAPALPTDRRYAYLWPFGQALSATLDIAALPEADPAVVSHAEQMGDDFFAHYWELDDVAPGGTAYPKDAGGEKFYDDNIWIGLDLVDLWRMTRHDRWLREASRIFDFVVSAWDDDLSHPSPGGIFWAQPMANPTRDRNTVSNAPGAILGLHLYAATGETHYLTWAQQMVDWVEQTLCDPDDCLYWDHLKLDGRIERTKWSYNQGTMVGALTLLSQALDNNALLERAQTLAHAALAHYTPTEHLWKQDPPFNAIFFRNLRILGDTINDHDFYRPALTDYAERAWQTSRDPRTGLVSFGRGKRVELLHQAAAVQIFALLAALAAKHL